MLFLEGNVIDCLRSLPEQSVHCVITSPPYWGLRDYGVPGQIGLEPTPEEYVAKMVEVFREVRRVLRDDGTLWLNLGDSFASGKGTCFNPGGGETSLGQNRKAAGVHPLDRGNKSTLALSGLKPKDLVGIPWMVAFALRADGWYLRSDIIWHKPNPMPESVKDRCTKSHEYIFLLTKSAQYYYDNEAIKEDAKPESEKRYKSTFHTGKKEISGQGRPGNASNTPGYKKWTGKRNKRSVWTIPTQPFPGAHFAVFPEALVEPCILAGTSEAGCCPKCGAPWVRVVEKETVNRAGWGASNPHHATPFGTHGPSLRGEGRCGDVRVTTLGWQPTCSCGLDPVPCVTLDPFGGSGTVAKVSRDLGRDSVYCDLNPDYVRMAMDRVCSSLFGNIEYRKIGTTVPGER